MLPGDCYCRPSVTGQTCDRCKEGAYNLSPNGCTDCGCTINGTVGGSLLCNITSGQCQCKIYVTGTKCETCMDGYYNLDPINPNGCTLCDCDVGGASSKICDKMTGLCTCRKNIIGRTCNQPDAGYYYPDFYFLSSEMENLNSPWENQQFPGFFGFGYIKTAAQVPASTSLDLSPMGAGGSDMFRILLRYIYPATVNISGTMAVGGGNVITSSNSFNLSSCNSWCYAGTGDVRLSRLTQPSVSFTFPGEVYLDRISAVPIEYFDTSALFSPTDSDTFQRTCNIITGNLITNGVLRDDCARFAFSLSMSYLNGALPCNCLIGANDSISCTPKGGQCFCKTGTTGRRCGMCMPRFYNLNADGCTPCSCNQTTYNMCDSLSGACLCPPGTEGATCGTCKLNYYNWDAVKGCQPCGCNAMGSQTLACDVGTGQCPCKTGVTGLKCELCQDGFKEMTSLGCSPCSCDPSGSVSGTTCDKVTANCVCKTNVGGTLCNSCKLDAFTLSPLFSEGCLSCLCMGISTTCSQANWLPNTFNLRPFPLSLVVVNDNGNLSSISPTSLPNSTTTFATIFVPQASNLYWSDPQLKGNLLSFYGASILFKVMWKADDSSPANPTQTSLVFIGNNGKVMNFLLSNYTPPSAGVETQLKAMISLENTLAFPSSGLTRAQIMVALADVRAVLFPATYKSTLHQSSIGDVSYELNPAYVEQCFCPSGYEGRSCESCSIGYMRYNITEQGYLGLCKPCECNGKSSSCDPLTGYCLNCQQFTTGMSCETCLSGYYRDPNSGSSGTCMKCPCQGNRVAVNDCSTINSTVICANCSVGYVGNICDQCALGYYGNLGSDLTGVCRPCLCNGFATVCDSLGICQNCSNNTMGNNCERCIPGMYKDPITRQCIDCNCNMTGSSSNVCDVEIGQCPCKTGITSQKCEVCLDQFYNFSMAGCLSCGCNQFGSQNLSCNGTGGCSCNSNTHGNKCDVCDFGSFGILNSKPCEACNCYPLGVDNSTSTNFASCDNTTGQCSCLPNVVGRTCNKCELMYFNTTEILNCSVCSTCEKSLGDDIRRMQNSSITVNQVKTMDLSNLKKLYDQFTTIETKTIQLCQSLQGCVNDNLFSAFQLLLASTNDSAVQNFSKALDLQKSLDRLSTDLGSLKNRSQIVKTEIQNIKQSADILFMNSGQQSIASQTSLRNLQTYNDTADKLWKNPPYNGTNLVYIPWNYGDLFNTENSTLNNLNNRVIATIQTGNQLINSLLMLISTANQIQANLDRSQQSFANTMSQIKTLNDSLNLYNGMLTERISGVNGAITIRSTFDVSYRSMMDTMRTIENTLSMTEVNFAVCQQRLSTAISLIQGNSVVRPQVLIDTGFQGWNQAYALVNQLLQNALTTLNSSLSLITATEQKAASLSTQAATILSSFQSVQSKGQPAVDVINRFQSIITSLTNAVNQAMTMDGTLQGILRSFSTVSVSDLQLRATQLLANINITKQTMDNFLLTSSANSLNASIDLANSSLQASVALWSDLNQRLTTFNRDSMDFQNSVLKSVQDNNQNVTASNQFADSLTAMMTSLRQQNLMLQSSLDNTASSVGNVANTIANSLTIQSQLMNNLTAFQKELDLANTTSITNLNLSQNSISSSKSSLDAQFARVDELLKQAQAKLAALEQPVYFAGNTFEQVTNPDTNVNLLYNSIGLDFSYNNLARGVLFFAENQQTQEKLLLQLINNTICFEFSFTDVKTLLCNVAQLSAGSWFRVYVTRYETDVKLTVVQLSTGGMLTVSGRSTSTNSVRILLNSPIFVGGLALNAVNILKVYNSGIGFNGCIYNVIYNGASLPVWQGILRSTSTATCCKKPSVIQRLSYITNCITLYGFGYIIYSPRDTFTLNGQVQISIQFRTFARLGVIFLTPSQSSSDYYGIFMQDGKVLFSITSGGATSSLITDNTYNNGLWFRLTASHSALTMTLTVVAVNSTQTETKTTPAVINLASLNGLGFIIGGQHPSYVRGPISYGFSGALKDFQHTTTFSSVLLPDSLNTGINSSANVDITRCLENVQAGLGFLNRSSYSIIRPLVSPISSIDFTFLTTSFSGVLFFAYLERPVADQSTFLYVSLYNGDIFIIFNQGIGVQPTFRTRNLYLSDGKEHKVTLSFTYTNSPRMKVDNLETHVGAVTMSPYMRLLDNTFYIGGVPATLSLDASVLPVKASYVGGMKQISLNDIGVQIYDPMVLSGQTSRAIYLSGIQLPINLAPPPCNPCPTTSAPLACVLPVPSNTFYDNSTFGFGLETENYIQYDITGDENVFLSGFQCSLQFKSLQPDGLIFYVASSQTPLNYFALYLFKGAINVVVMNGTSSMSVATKKTYYDGLWHKVSVYLAISSLAILVQESEDFNNYVYNGTFNLRVNSPLYVGGVPYALTPYPDAILSGKESFKGCLQNIIFQSSSMRTLTINGSKIITRKGLSQCSVDTKMGMNIASSGYIRVSDSYNANPFFNLAPPFSVFISFKTSLTTGVLVVAWDSSSKFVSMSIVGGEIQVILSSTSQPFTFTSKAFRTGYTICNNVFHNVTMTINLASVTLNIDSNYTESKNFDLFQYAAPLSVPIYLGGVRDPSWDIPGIFSSTGFVGCIQRCQINGNPVYITQSADVNGALSGCT